VKATSGEYWNSVGYGGQSSGIGDAPCDQPDIATRNASFLLEVMGLRVILEPASKTYKSILDSRPEGNEFK